MKKNKKLVIAIITLILIFIGSIVYYSRDIIKFHGKRESGDIRLEIRFGEWTGGPFVLEGKEMIEKYVKDNNKKDIVVDYISLSNLDIAYDEIIKYNGEFIVYGKFTGEVINGELMFNVNEWTPKNKILSIVENGIIDMVIALDNPLIIILIIIFLILLVGLFTFAIVYSIKR